jgi:twitching motility protein PilT
MPGIDQLLQVVHERGGAHGALVLEPGREARLRAGASELPITREPLDAATIHRLLQGVSPEPLSRRPGAGQRIEFRYPLGLSEFLVSAFNGAAGWQVSARTARAGGAAAAASVAAAPATAASRGAAAAPATAAVPAAPRPLTTNPVAAVPVAAPPAPAPRVDVESASRPLPSIPQLLRELTAARGSDLHLASAQAPRWRIDGDLMVILGYDAPAPDALRSLLWEITPEHNRAQFEARHDTDFAYELPGTGRFRVNLFRDRLGIGAVMRQIPEKIPTAEDLGLSEAVRNLAYLSKGLVLVTGPTGSGKSTTLAAIVDLVNRTRNDHIITIEDPVEFVHPSRRCLVNQREVHVHTDSFKQALRAALREDPDVVLVGELRDLETISIAIETAETGHLVFGTLHTTTATSTVERLVDQFPGDRQEQVRMMLADSLKAVIAQTLLKRRGGGRVAAQEILLANPAVSNLIREGKTFQLASAMQTGRAKGMILLNDALLDLVSRGVVEPREAYLKAIDKENLVKAFKAASIPFDPPVV